MAEPAPSEAMLALLALHEEDLPETDNRPIPDSDQQFRWIVHTSTALLYRYADRDDVAVSADIFMYHLPLHGQEPRTNRAGRPVYPRMAVDVLVSFGVPKRDRLSYVVADEGKPPDFVLEVATTSTWRRDYGQKRKTYEALGVREYFVYDARPEAAERLAGFRLRGGVYEEVVGAPISVGGPPGLRSEVLGLRAHLDDQGGLRWYDPVSGEDLRTLTEAERERRAAERKADAEVRARQQAERQADAKAEARQQAERQADAKAEARQQAERKRKAAERKADAEVRARQQAERERDQALRQMEAMAAELARRRGA